MHLRVAWILAEVHHMANRDKELCLSSVVVREVKASLLVDEDGNFGEYICTLGVG